MLKRANALLPFWMFMLLGLSTPAFAVVGALTGTFSSQTGQYASATMGGIIFSSAGTTWHVTSQPALPAGLTVSVIGHPFVSNAYEVVVSGTVATPVNQTYAITVTRDGDTGSGTGSLIVLVEQALTVTGSFLPATVGRSASGSASASGGSGSGYQVGFYSGTLPPGISAGGNSYSGTPTSAGSYTFTVRAMDSAMTTADQSFTWLVNPAVTMGAPTGGAIALNTSTVFGGPTASGGTAPIVYSATGMPPGLTINSATASITGSATAAGNYTIIITGTDANGSAASSSISLAVFAPFSAPPTASASGVVGSPMSYQLTSTGGAAPITFSTSGSLPGGLTLSSSGLLSGTPTTAGTTTVTVDIADLYSNPVSTTLTIQITAAISVTLSGVSPVTQNTTVSGQAGASGGMGGPFTYSIQSGSLPGGVTLSAQGALAGAPSQAGTFSFVVRAQDGHSNSGTQSFSWTVNPALQVQFPSLGSTRVGKTISAATQHQGGTAPVTISVSSGSLPPGVNLSPDGAISGAASAAGTYTFTLRVADSGGAAATQPVSLTVGPALQMSPSGTLPPATVNASYTVALGIVNGEGAGVFSVGASTLPPGLTLNGSAISGIPTQAGSYLFGVEGRLDGEVVSSTLSLVVNPAFEFKLPVAPTLVAGSAFTWTPSLSGGTPPYLVSIAGSSLPAGITLDRATGIIHGVPAAPGTLAFSIEAFDQNGARVQHYVQLDVKSPILFTPQIARVAKLNEPWAVKLEASSGVAPYQFSLASGQLPVGVVLSGEALSGAPTMAGTYTFKLAATDARGLKVEKPFTVVVTDGFLLSTNSLSFVAQPGQVSGRRTLKLDSIPVGVDVTVGELPAWLKASVTASATPGAVEFWVSPGAELPSGDHTATVSFESPGLAAQKLEVKLKLARSEDYTLSVNSWTLPSGTPERAVLLQTAGAEVSYTLHLEGPGAPSYRLPVTQGTATQDGFHLVRIELSEDATRRGLETTLVVENQSIAQTLRVPIDVSQVAPTIVSSDGLTLRIPNTEPHAATANVLVKTQSGKRRFALTVDSPWLTVTPMQGVLDPEQELHVEARKSLDDAGIAVGLVTIYLEDGKPAHVVPVTALYLPAIAPVTPLVSMSRQVFDPRQPGAELTLTNPYERPLNFALRSTTGQISVDSTEGQLAAGESRTLKVSATEFSRPESLFVSFGDGSPVVMDLFWLTAQKNCTAQPTLEWVTPLRGSTLPVGVSAQVQALVTNGCGEALTKGSMAVLDAQGQPVSLLGNSRGIWSGYLMPGTKEGNRTIELLYVSADGKSQLRKLLNVDLK